MTSTSSAGRALRRAGRAAVNIVLALVVLGCAAWLAPSLLGYDRYVITGGSMSGTFEKGALAFERAVPVEELGVGDVITYRPPADAGTSDLVTHRISRVTTDPDGRRVFRTRGDANDAPDPWTFSLARDTQPVVAFTVPYAGYAFIALADRELRMLLVGGPAAVIALLALAELARALRRTPAGAETGAGAGVVAVASAQTATGAPLPGHLPAPLPAPLPAQRVPADPERRPTTAPGS